MSTEASQEEIALRQEDANAREVIEGANDAIVEAGGDQDRTAQLPDDVDPATATRRKPIHMSPADEMRANIAKRFKRGEADDEVPFNGDMTDPEMLYGRHGRAPEQEPDPAAPEPGVPVEPAPAPVAPKTRKLVIRGREVELTEDEILARAMKVTAADSYLDEAKQLLDEAKSIRGGRSPASPQRPEGNNESADDGLTDPPTPDGEQRPVNRLAKAVEKIQFGDPEEAARELEQVIDEVADNRADKRHLDRLMSQDLVKSQAALKAFTAKYPDIANDEDAAALVERGMYRLFREEIIALGTVDPDKIPTDPRQLANWHRFHRIHNDPVSKVDDLLEKSRSHLLAWRGGAQVTKPNATERPKPAPRVDVDVDRTQRRAALPNQPTRTVSPRLPDSVTAQKRDASSVIQKMRQARGQLTA